MTPSENAVRGEQRTDALCVALVLKAIGGSACDDLVAFLAPETRGEVERHLAEIRSEPAGRRRARLLNLAAGKPSDVRAFLRTGRAGFQLSRRILAGRPMVDPDSGNSSI